MGSCPLVLEAGHGRTFLSRQPMFLFTVHFLHVRGHLLWFLFALKKLLMLRVPLLHWLHLGHHSSCWQQVVRILHQPQVCSLDL